ncbi:VOC family protein [Arthrobacter antioxidans]|uniref:VOC family protein n=1 Tax=Arthrobacter antioxidans TaxID=2895818 RepID=UPI001FFFC7A1|nr:VOC family protein [Arthrobacter antioxidans]
MSTLLIDAPSGEAGASAVFWAGALGVPVESPLGEPQFHTLLNCVPDLVVAVQSIDDTARYHVDIETDDVSAEVARLTALGAVEVADWQGCRTLRVPGGHLLCVIPVHSSEATFKTLAHMW